MATGTIVDNDTARVRVANVSSAVEGTGAAAVFPVTLTLPSANTIEIAYVTVGGTAIAGEDFVPVTGTVTFAPGQTLVTVPVPIVDDSMDEDPEAFQLRLSDAVGATIADDRATAIVTDDDAPPAVSIGDASVQEGTGPVQATVTFTLDAPSGKTVRVTYETVDGTAVAGADYTAKSGTVTFQPGVTTRTIAVTVRRDTLTEGTEQFLVELSNPVNATIGTATGTVSIADRP